MKHALRTQRKLANEKKLESDAKKCQKINSFLAPISNRKGRKENNDNNVNEGAGGIDLPDENGDNKVNEDEFP